MVRGRIRGIRGLFVFLESHSVRISLAIPLPFNGEHGTNGYEDAAQTEDSHSRVTANGR